MLMADGSFIQTGSSMIKLPQTAVRHICYAVVSVLVSLPSPIVPLPMEKQISSAPHIDFKVRRNSAASGLGSGSEMDFDEEDSEAPQDCEEESPSQAQPWNGPEALGRAVLLIEGLKVKMTIELPSLTIEYPTLKMTIEYPSLSSTIQPSIS